MRLFPVIPALLILVGCSKTESGGERAAAVAPAHPSELAVTKETPLQPPPAAQTNHVPPVEVQATPAPPTPAVAVALPAVVVSAPPEAKPLEVPPAKADPVTNAAAASHWDKLRGIASRATNFLSSATVAPTSTIPMSASAVDLSTDQVTRGLKEALAKGLDHAIAQLGKDGGFLTNANVRIPMPEQLQTVEKLLRRAGQDQLADEFVTTMNRAAEKAVPAAATVFADSLKQMSVTDAQAILQGPKDAATEYFRRTAGPQLEAKFKPIVSQATAQAGVTAAYKNVMDRASFATAFLKKDSLDLDTYVTSKASDGLFKMIADEEKRIRENPVARTTDLLKSVFGALGK